MQFKSTLLEYITYRFEPVIFLSRNQLNQKLNLIFKAPEYVIYSNKHQQTILYGKKYTPADRKSMFCAPDDLGFTGECLKAWFTKYDLEDGFLESIEGNVRESQDSDGDLGSREFRPSGELALGGC